MTGSKITKTGSGSVRGLDNLPTHQPQRTFTVTPAAQENPAVVTGRRAPSVAGAIAGMTLGFALLVGGPAHASGWDPLEQSYPQEVGVQTQAVTKDSAASAQAAFDKGLKSGAEKRNVAAAIGMAPGQLLVDSEIPIIKNLGETLKSAGQLVSSPFTLLAGVFTADGEVAQDGLEDFARGVLGVVGLEQVVMGKWEAPPTGSIAAPGKYAGTLRDAKNEWNSYSDEEQNRDYDQGMKKWHTLSNAKLASRAGLTEIPWLWLGGVIHELDPGGISAEVESQGLAAWAWDSPLDIVANTVGMVGGMLLPESKHKEYARVVGNIIPGPHDPFETGEALGSGGTKSSD